MYDVAYEIMGVVATQPVSKMTKGDERRPPEPVCCFLLYQLVEDAEKRLVDSGRRISIGYYSPTETSMSAGDIVKVNAGPIYARPWERNGKKGVHYWANTRRSGLAILERRGQLPLRL